VTVLGAGASGLDIAPAIQWTQLIEINGQNSRYSYPNEKLSPRDAEILQDVNLSENGAAESRNGYDEWLATQITSANAIMGFWEGEFRDYGTRRVIVTRTKVYEFDGTTLTDLTGTDLTGGAEDRVQFEFVNETLYINNRTDQIQLWSGDLMANCAAMTGMPWTKAGGLLLHNGLVLATSLTESAVSHRSRIRWSDINTQTMVADPTVWNADNQFDVGTTGKIVRAVENWEQVWIFKRDGVYPGSVTYSDLGFFRWRPNGAIRGFQPIAPDGFHVDPNFIFGIGEEGAFVLDRNGTFRRVTDGIRDQWDLLNKSRLPYAQAYVRHDDHQVRVLMSSSGNSSGHDKVLVWDWDNDSVWFDTPNDTMSTGGRMTVSGNEFDFLGSLDGYLFKANDPTKTQDNGTSISWRIKMQPWDLGMPGKNKRIHWVRTVFRRRQGQGSVTHRIHRDQGQAGTRSTILNLNSGLIWDSAGQTWNSGRKWPAGSLFTKQFWVNRDAITIQPEWLSDSPAGIIAYQVGYEAIE
jgi:hypothetical protein